MERRALCQDIILIQLYVCVCACGSVCVPLEGKKRLWRGKKNMGEFLLMFMCVFECEHVSLNVKMCHSMCVSVGVCVSKDARLSPAMSLFLPYLSLCQKHMIRPDASFI